MRIKKGRSPNRKITRVGEIKRKGKQPRRLINGYKRCER